MSCEITQSVVEVCGGQLSLPLHWSSKGDGVYDQHTIFADKLRLPRMLLPLDKGRAIIGETDTNDLFIYTDTDGPQLDQSR